MTGKEALIILSKSCSALALEFGNLKIGKTDNEALQTLKEIVVKYDKYMRAFEVLRKFDCFGFYKHDDNKTYEITTVDDYMLITDEEKELLKEVLGNENT